MSDITAQLDALAALREAATPEPWQTIHHGCGVMVADAANSSQALYRDGERQSGWVNTVAPDTTPENAAYIAALVNAAPSLIATIRDLRAERDVLREVVDGFEGLLDIPHVVHRASGHESVYARHKTRLDAARTRLASLKGAHHE